MITKKVYFYALKYLKMKKLYSPFALRTAFVVLLMLTFVRGWGQTYTQITTAAELVDGTYLIIGDGNTTTNDGMMINTVTTGTNPYINFSAISNPGATISTDATTANEFQITVVSGVITINSSSVGYVSWGRTGVTGNAAVFFNGTVSNNERWTTTVASGLWTLSNVATPARLLQWNQNAGQGRFASYTTVQVKLKLYKLATTTPCSGTPSAGTASVSPNSGSPGTDYVVSATGYSSAATGLTYQWEYNINGAGWSNTSPINIPSSTSYANYSATDNALAPAVGQSVQWRLVTACSNPGGGSNTSSTATFSSVLSYCTPTYSNGGAYDIITRVQLGLLDDTSIPTGSPYYYDRRSAQNAIPELVQGSTNTLSVTVGSDGNQRGRAWIDFNQNGTFEAGESFATGTNWGSNGTENITMIVPAGAMLGPTRLRIRAADDVEPTGTQACNASGSTYGRAVDYTVNIVAAATTSYSGVAIGAGTEPATISSLINTQAASSLNFDFTVNDDANTAAGNDALPTLINQIIIPQGTGNDITDWTQAIAGAELSDGSNSMTGTVNVTNITFGGINTATLGNIADGSNKTYVLKIWLNTSLGGTLPTTIDGLNLAFKIDRTNFTTASSATSTQFEAGAGTAVESGSTNNAVTVVASTLAFVQQPSNTEVGTAMSPAVTVSANDANGNRDRGFTSLVEITSDGTLTGDPVGVNAVNGLATFSGLTHTAVGTGLQMLAGSGSWTTDVSSNFNITVAVGNFYRSKNSGIWAATSSWQHSTDNITWGNASSVPTSINATSIIIRDTHKIDISTADVSMTNTSVQSGGVLELSGVGQFTLDGADEIELTVENGGVFIINNDLVPFGNAYGLIKSGGKLVAGPNSVSAFFVEDYILALSGSLFYFENQGICEWNNPTQYPVSNGYYNLFDTVNQSDMPIFRITSLPANQGYGNGNHENIINALLEVNSTETFNFQGNTTKTIIGGIRGTGNVNQNSNSGNIILGNDGSVPNFTYSHIPEIGGTVTLSIQDYKLKLLNGANVPVGANAKIQSVTGTQNHRIHRQGGNLTIDGTLDITNLQITNAAAGSTIVNGTLRTANTNGLYGTGAAVLNGTTLTLNNNSTIDYNATANQAISSAPNYYNLEISGSGIKTVAANTLVNNITKVTAAELLIKKTDDLTNPVVFTAKNGLNVATGATFRLENNAQLMQDEAATANNEGSIIVERDVTDMDNVLATQMDYIYWSSPVADQPTNGANAFSPGTDPAFFFDYKEADDIFYPTPDTTFQRGKGYAVGAEVGVAFPTGYDATYRFTGKPNNGAFNGQPLLKSATGGGYNLVGNPYPSNIDLDKLFALNSDRIASVAFMWVNTGIYTENQMGSGYAGNNYSVYNEAGGTPATAFTVGFNAPTKTIKVGQGFIVESKTNVLPLKFDHSIRDTDKGTGFYQKANEAAKNRYWLQHISPETVVNTMLVGYFDDATAGFDKNYDAELFSSPNDVIYSVLNNLKLLIQGKNIFNVNDKVSLGTNQNAVGNYRIKLAHKEGIFENGQAIYLHDKLNNTYTNLQETDFTYAATKGATVNRFEIVYEPSATLGTGANTKESIQVYRNGENFVVKSGQSKIDEVEVFDASGRLFQKVKGGSVEVTIPAATLASGIYILKISRSNETISKKIIK